MAKMTLAKWKQIGRICGYDGTRTAATWSKEADRLRRACPYELWKKMATTIDNEIELEIGKRLRDMPGNFTLDYFDYQEASGGETSKFILSISKKYGDGGLQAKLPFDAKLFELISDQVEINVFNDADVDPADNENLNNIVRMCTQVMGNKYAGRQITED